MSISSEALLKGQEGGGPDSEAAGTPPELIIKDLRVASQGVEILHGVSLTVRGGEVHAIMGPNGTGKSTLASAIMGHPHYTVTGGSVLLDGQDLLAMKVDERARRGLFLAMQYPSEIPGVRNADFLRAAVNARRPPDQQIGVLAFHRQMEQAMRRLEMDPRFAERYVNDGFSGGEKKRNEALQLSLLRPRVAILDEIDSGLDVDALRDVATTIQEQRRPDLAIIVITHYQRILQYIPVDFVHVMMDGRIVLSGGPELVGQVEARGYEWVRQAVALEPDKAQFGAADALAPGGRQEAAAADPHAPQAEADRPKEAGR